MNVFQIEMKLLKGKWYYNNERLNAVSIPRALAFSSTPIRNALFSIDSNVYYITIIINMWFGLYIRIVALKRTETRMPRNSMSFRSINRSLLYFVSTSFR